MLSTAAPSGVELDRGYEDRGWTCFERAEGQLIKPDALCIDIGLFSIDKAFKALRFDSTPLRIGDAPFAERSVEELARQGSYRHSAVRGLLGDLAPLAPEANVRFDLI